MLHRSSNIDCLHQEEEKTNSLKYWFALKTIRTSKDNIILDSDENTENINTDPVLDEVLGTINEKDTGRAARFLRYWTTSTTTSTSTSYTATSILGTLECTPTNFIYNSCG